MCLLIFRTPSSYSVPKMGTLVVDLSVIAHSGGEGWRAVWRRKGGEMVVISKGAKMLFLLAAANKRLGLEKK